MKLQLILLLLIVSGAELFSQNDSELRFIFMPHPRSDDRVNQSVHSRIAKIDFTKYDVIMLGGDLTFNTDKDSATIAYCDDIFNLGSPNTLWSFGNHDVINGRRGLIKKFTGRDSYYSYNRNRVTFLVLDTELNANSSQSTFITGNQLKMVEDVCDTINNSKALILLHHRFMWMINNDDFTSRLTDSIAASSRSLDTTNFYADIYPLLQQVKNRGIPVFVFGGDRSDFNVEYSPEDSITFYAARLKNDIPDSLSNVIVINYNLQTWEVSCSFVPIADIITSVVSGSSLPGTFALYQNYPNPFNPSTRISYSISKPCHVSIIIYDILGRDVCTLVNEEKPTGNYLIDYDGSGMTSGIYFYQMKVADFIETKKMILLK